MKCQKCGKNEINFHYSSNINGSVTEAHLCTECAAESGYDFDRMFGADEFFGSMSPFGSSGSFLPLPLFGLMTPFGGLRQMRLGMPNSACACEDDCQDKNAGEDAILKGVGKCPEAEVDGEMQGRREINVLREQMRCAAEKEDFEKAAQLRDQIRSLEAESE